MEDVRHSKPTGPGSSELGAILELQKMIAEELDESTDLRSFSRSFTPLTDGLGLDAPKKRDVPLQSPVRETAREMTREMERESARELAKATPIIDESIVMTQETPSVTESAPAAVADRAPQSTLASVIEPARAEVASEAVDAHPPQLPRPSVWRRLFATCVDETFVILLWATAVLITANALNGSSNYFSLGGLANLHHPQLGRFALLEFCTLWLCYFAVCLGLLDMTFGMWVWGIRVGYGDEGRDVGTRFWKKMVRVLLSFFFFAPIAPLLLLLFNRRGRNLLDGLSGTHLYRSMV